MYTHLITSCDINDQNTTSDHTFDFVIARTSWYCIVRWSYLNTETLWCSSITHAPVILHEQSANHHRNIHRYNIQTCVVKSQPWKFVVYSVSLVWVLFHAKNPSHFVKLITTIHTHSLSLAVSTLFNTSSHLCVVFCLILQKFRLC